MRPKAQTYRNKNTPNMVPIAADVHFICTNSVFILENNGIFPIRNVILLQEDDKVNTGSSTIPHTADTL